MRDRRPQEAMEAGNDPLHTKALEARSLSASSCRLFIFLAAFLLETARGLLHSCRTKATKLIEERTFDQKGFTPGGNSKNYIIVADRRSPITFQSLFTSLSHPSPPPLFLSLPPSHTLNKCFLLPAAAQTVIRISSTPPQLRPISGVLLGPSPSISIQFPPLVAHNTLPCPAFPSLLARPPA